MPQDGRELRVTLGTATPPAARAEGEGRAKGHSPSRGRPPGPARTARAAAQVARRRGREFESRFRKGLRLRAAPAHGQPPGLRLSQLLARPPGTPARARLPSARQEVGADPGLQREGGGRGGTGIFPVGGDSGRGWNPAIGGSQGPGETSRRCELELGLKAAAAAGSGAADD